MGLGRRAGLGWAAVGLLVCALKSPVARADEDDVFVEMHFQPAPRAQIAIWFSTADGQFVQDVFVTQATGSLGIGNRPGRRDFLSSWRFPYGPRPQVLPIWAHARGRTYPKLIWHDTDGSDQNSLGWHESTSYIEPYFCRPLAEAEHDTISVDTMTCPSPGTFNSDKGRFDPSGATSVYPPRNDLTMFKSPNDHDDAWMFSALNDLDAFTAATPAGHEPEIVTTIIEGTIAKQGPLVAWIEVHTEHDENAHWAFDRDDHYIDPRLPGYGIEYFGQPSVVYRVQFDPALAEFAGTNAYAGYGEFEGTSGTIHPPDATISQSGGSGADRLASYSKNGETFRFGVYSHGLGSGHGMIPAGSGWGSCRMQSLPAMSEIELEPLEFDTVRVHFSLPAAVGDVDIRNVRIYYRVGEMPIDAASAGGAVQTVPGPEDCGGDLRAGGSAWCDLRELFGNHHYQIGIRYEDACKNASAIMADEITTPRQEFAMVEGPCFVATAAFGAPWEQRVAALRAFRDVFLRGNVFGTAFIVSYYGYGPSVAAAIAKNPYARVVARAGLLPITEAATALMGRRR